MKTSTKIGSGIVVVALPLISKFIIRDAIPINTQLFLIFGSLIIVSSILAGVFYFRSKDLEKSQNEIKEENKTTILNLETKHDDEIKSLKEKIRDLENNREALKNMINNEIHTNYYLRARIALFAMAHSEEKRLEIEQAATLHIGGIIDGSESNQNN